jgi:predicted ATPase/tRNA A-37 threonylcarbamoyl transferase component Bud32
MIGSQIGPYRVDRKLGRGGMGEVYLAFDSRLDRSVAIKVLPESKRDLDQAVERFLREAKAASALNHPNIVTIHEVGQTDDGSHFMVQEFVDGETLRARMRRDKAMPLETVVEVGRQVARALAAAHAHGIVHRDIKPENVMLRRDGYVKVLDFGLARIASAEATYGGTVSRLETNPGAILGTAHYMSPEQAQGVAVTAATDLFSLGILLYEMATGERPFTVETGLAALHAIVTMHPLPPSRRTPSLPTAFDGLVLRMLAKDPALRPSAADVEAELASVIGAVRLGVAATAPGRRTVGREAERGQLRQAFESTAAERGSFVAILGEPGIGKSSLAEDFLGEIASGQHHPVIARGKCSERLAGAEAYLPVLEALDNLLHGGSGDSFGSMMRQAAPVWYLQVAPLSTESTTTQSMHDDAKTASQERMKRELGSLLQEISRVRPLVLFFEDVHWADVSTIDLLNYLGGRIGSMRVMILVTYRPSEMMIAKHPYLRVRRDLQAAGVLREIPLDFLGREDVEHYLSLEFPEHRFPAEFSALVHGKTEGNPLFMVDVLRYLRDRGVISQQKGTWELARSLPDIEQELPDSVRAAIDRKIERLDEVERKLLVAASVQGHEFDSAIVAEVTALDPADVEEHLEALSRVHAFVRPLRDQELPDRTLSVRYRFVHVLYQNALYGALQPTRRASLSGKVARALVGHYGGKERTIASELAVLYESARDFTAAARYFLDAAQHAAALLAFREAVVLCRRGLDALRSLPDDPERDQQELGLQLILGLSLRSVEGWAAPEVERIYVRARQLCHQLGDAPQLFPVLWGLTLYHAIRGDLRVFQPLAEQLLRQAGETQTPMFEVAAHQMMASVNEFLGNTVESSRHFEQALTQYVPQQGPAYTSTFGLDPGMISLSLSPRPLWFLGFADRALERIEETVTLARRLRQPISMVFAICLASNIRLLRGEAEDAVRHADEEIAVCREYGLAQELEWGRSFRGLAIAHLGRIDDGIAELRDSLQTQQAISAGLLRGMVLTFLAEALWMAGRAEEGLTAVDEAEAHAEQSLERFYLAETYRMRGELQRLRGDEAAAAASLRLALSQAQNQGALAFELRAAMSLARLRRAQDASDEARELLEPVYLRFTEGFDTGDLRAARSLLESVAT